MKKIYTMDVWIAKTSSNTGYCQPRHSPVLETAIRAFHTSLWIHPCYNQPRVRRLEFRLETNSTVVWLYAGDNLYRGSDDIVWFVWCKIWFGFPRSNHMHFCFIMTFCKYRLGIAKPENFFSVILNPCYEILKIFF